MKWLFINCCFLVFSVIKVCSTTCAMSNVGNNWIITAKIWQSEEFSYWTCTEQDPVLSNLGNNLNRQGWRQLYKPNQEKMAQLIGPHSVVKFFGPCPENIWRTRCHFEF